MTNFPPDLEASMSSEGLILRLATMEDADLLLAWRNDATTRQASHHTAWVTRAEHIQWLKRALSSDERWIYIAEDKSGPVGMVRADEQGDIFEISWSVAPEARGKGIAGRMVKGFTARIRGALRAEIKTRNMASVKVAERAGMVFDREENGVLHYSRPALTTS